MAYRVTVLVGEVAGHDDIPRVADDVHALQWTQRFYLRPVGAQATNHVDALRSYVGPELVTTDSGGIIGQRSSALRGLVVHESTIHIAVLLYHLLDDRIDPGGGAFVVTEVSSHQNNLALIVLLSRRPNPISTTASIVPEGFS